MSHGPEPRRHRWGRWLVAVGLGGLAGLGFEPYAWWPLHLAGLAGLFWLLSTAPSRRRAAWWGYGFGVGLNAVALNWLSSLLPGSGPVIALVLALFMALYFAIIALGIHSVRSLPLWPVWTAGVWVAGEWLYSRFPFGGFGWTRSAYTMVDAPLAAWLPFVSVAGVGFLTALVAALIALMAHIVTRMATGEPIRRTPPLVASIAVVMLVFVGGALVPTGREPSTAGDLTIGMVQGNVDGSGVSGMGRARSVTNNHYSETITLMARARAGQLPRPDLVLWPENSTDVDPLQDPQTRRLIQSAAEVTDVPILVGAVMSGPGPDERQTRGLWWMPDDTVAASYDKRNLVPFGEYIPFRDQLLPLLPVLELVGAQSVPGTTPGVLTAPLADGRHVAVGDVICFELAYDDTVREAVTGSQVLVVQSNNATYRGTPQIEQQFAMTRVRAIEARRDIVVATTNSVSGHIAADGSVRERTTEMTNASGSYIVPLRGDLTPATRFGGIIEGVLVALGVGTAVVGALPRTRSVR